MELKKAFNIYCDESRVDNPDSKIMVIGALDIERKSRDEIYKKIVSLENKYSFKYEIKWVKTSDKYFEFYKDLLQLYKENGNINYRCIVIDKEKINYKLYHNDDKELAFYKFYYLLLKQKLLGDNEYYIFVDRKPSRDKNRLRALHAYLESNILQHQKKCSIKHIQAYDSKENKIIQLCDFITGLIGHGTNSNDNPEGIKNQVVGYFQDLMSFSFKKVDPSYNKKLDCFYWRGKDE